MTTSYPTQSPLPPVFSPSYPSPSWGGSDSESGGESFERSVSHINTMALVIVVIAVAIPALSCVAYIIYKTNKRRSEATYNPEGLPAYPTTNNNSTGNEQDRIPVTAYPVFPTTMTSESAREASGNFPTASTPVVPITMESYLQKS